MEHDNALYLALGYVWGSDDHAGTGRTAGAMKFSDAFAQGYDEYNTKQRNFMPPVSDAYKAWQESNGDTIFRTEVSQLTGFTCVARPCKHYPNTEIPVGQLEWVIGASSTMSYHTDCADAL